MAQIEIRVPIQCKFLRVILCVSKLNNDSNSKMTVIITLMIIIIVIMMMMMMMMMKIIIMIIIFIMVNKNHKFKSYLDLFRAPCWQVFHVRGHS